MSHKIAQKMREGVTLAQQNNWDVESRCWILRDTRDNHIVRGMCPLSLAYYAETEKYIDRIEQHDKISAIIFAIDPNASYPVVSDLIQLWDDDKLTLEEFIQLIEEKA